LGTPPETWISEVVVAVAVGLGGAIQTEVVAQHLRVPDLEEAADLGGGVLGGGGQGGHQQGEGREQGALHDFSEKGTVHPVTEEVPGRV
jgi:hypothetical protein